MKIRNHSLPLYQILSTSLQFINSKFKDRLVHYPLLSVVLMVLIMCVSAIFCFSFRRQPEEKSKLSYQIMKSSTPDGAGVNAASLLEIIALQSELKTFLDSNTPTKQDSIRMEHILLRIQQLNQKLKNNEKN